MGSGLEMGDPRSMDAAAAATAAVAAAGPWLSPSSGTARSLFGSDHCFGHFVIALKRLLG
jgi:hypothetical protein